MLYQLSYLGARAAGTPGRRDGVYKRRTRGCPALPARRSVPRHVDRSGRLADLGGMSRLLPVLPLTCLLMLLPLAAGKAAGQPDPPALLRQAVALACPEGETAGLLAALPGARALAEEEGDSTRAPARRRLLLADGGLLELERLAPGGHLRRFTVTFEEAHG